MNCNTKKVLCFCTVCIAGLIDNFFGLGEGGSPKKKITLLRGVMEKNLMMEGEGS